MMKKAIFFIAVSAFVSLMIACGNSNKAGNDSESRTQVVTPADVVNPHQVGEEHTVIGVTIDRAMNSIIVLDENGDSVTFSYADIDDRSKIHGSNIGDTVTVKYVTLADNRDSVTAIFRGKRP